MPPASSSPWDPIPHRLFNSQVSSMSIDTRCREQQSAADRMFMDFKYTKPGSKDQLRALMTLSFLVSMWSDFLEKEKNRMDSVLALEGLASGH